MMETSETENARLAKEIRDFSTYKERNSEKPWGFLPPFADDANRQLHASILELEETLGRLDNSIVEHSSRTSTIIKHTENVKQEIQFTTAQVNAKKKEMETEEHLKKLAQRETGRLESEGNKLQQEKTSLEGTIHNFDMNIFQLRERLNQFRQQMNFNAEDLDRWVKEREKIEEDKAVLEKYKRQDEIRVKELNLQIQNLNRQIIKTKDELQNEITETQALQSQLEKTAEDFRKSHGERVTLLNQWNETVGALKLRDRNIEETNNYLKEKQEDVQKKTQLVKSLEEDVMSADNENQDLETQLQLKERQLSRLKEQLQIAQGKNLNVKRERDLLQSACFKAEKELLQKHAENANSEKQLQVSRSTLIRALENFEKTKINVEEEKARLEKLELKDSEFQKKVETESRRLKETEKELADLKKQQYKAEQCLFEDRQQETLLASSISGVASQDRNLRSKIAQMDEEILKQEEVLYNISFKVVMMERTVERASGVRTQAETRELQTEIRTLTESLDKVNSEHSMLINQLKRTEHELDQADKRQRQQTQEKERIEQGVEEMQLDSDMIQKQIKEHHEEKENLMVEEDVLNLQVSRLRDMLQSKSNEVSSLESRKEFLKSSIRNKKAEIAAHRDCLKFELKNNRDDLHRVKVELSDRHSRAEKLQQKYSTLLSKKESSIEVEPTSHSYKMIRAAQEKEELKQEAQELEITIKTTESEVAGLENALQGVTACNHDYKLSLRSDTENALFQQRQELTEELEAAYDQLKYRRSDETSLLGDIKKAESRFVKVQENLSELSKTITELTDQMRQAEQQRQEQLDKETRAMNRARKLLGEAKKKSDVSEGVIKLSVVQDINRAVLSDLRTASIVQQCGAATAAIEEMETSGITMPNANSCRSTPRSTRPNSTQSQRPASGASTNSLTIKQMHLEL